MRTFIFATKAEGADIQRLLGGQIFGILTREALVDLQRYLDRDEDAVVILTGQVWLMGWSTDHEAQIMFSQKFPKDEPSREQARGRVRGGNFLDRQADLLQLPENKHILDAALRSLLRTCHEVELTRKQLNLELGDKPIGLPLTRPIGRPINDGWNDSPVT